MRSVPPIAAWAVVLSLTPAAVLRAGDAPYDPGVPLTAKTFAVPHLGGRLPATEIRLPEPRTPVNPPCFDKPEIRALYDAATKATVATTTVGLLEKLDRLCPDAPNALFDLGIAYQKAGRSVFAGRLYGRYLTLFPHDWEVWKKLAQVEHALGNRIAASWFRDAYAALFAAKVDPKMPPRLVLDNLRLVSRKGAQLWFYSWENLDASGSRPIYEATVTRTDTDGSAPMVRFVGHALEHKKLFVALDAHLASGRRTIGEIPAVPGCYDSGREAVLKYLAAKGITPELR
ncbi:MAG: hypothetical protein HY815_31260 [Candidatus Riflebacteria bacterium]|nr:hypothetical protein [Candidatus Riflebacteria bacterium]